VRAAVLRGHGRPLVVEERPAPEPSGEEMLVRVLGAGVCHTDVHLVDREDAGLRKPLVLGHEISGEAGDLGPVLVYGAWGCGRCPACARGEEQLCPARVQPGFERDGGYAELVVVPSRRHLLPLEGLDPVRSAPLADAALTAYRAARRVREPLVRGGVCLVVGIGGLGQFAVQLVRLLTDGEVVAIDPDAGKRNRALELGAREALAPEEAAAGVRAHAVLDFVGSDETLALAASAVLQEGTVVVVGADRGRVPFGIGAVPWEATFVTSLMGSLREQAAVLEHARRGDLDWHVETLPLERADEAIDRVRRGDVRGRIVLVP
jgi:propanol-preferring alcohol dehydrogenase